MVTTVLNVCRVLACLLPAGALANTLPERTLEFSIVHEVGSPLFQYSAAYLPRLCAEAGLQCRLASLPMRRSEAQLTESTLDGEVGRARTFLDKHPDFALVEPSFFTIRTYAFTLPETGPVNSWAALPGRAASASYKRGILYYQSMLERTRPRVQAHDVSDSTACLRMVLTRRDQACIIDDGHLSREMLPLLADGTLGRPLTELDMYIVLNPRTAALAPLLSSAAQRLRARGIEDELLRKAFNPRSALPRSPR